MSADGFTTVTGSSRRENKRANQARRKVLRVEFDTTEWPRLRRERAAACKAKFEHHQTRLMTETKEAYAVRIQKAVETALKKYDLAREDLFETYFADMLARGEGTPADPKSVMGGGATLMPMPPSLRVALPLPVEEAPPVEKSRPPRVKPSVKVAPVQLGVANVFDALADESEE